MKTARVPKMIFKIGWSHYRGARETIQKNIEPLRVDHMDIGQLCLGGELAEEFRTGGKCYEGFQKIKDEGLVENSSWKFFPGPAKFHSMQFAADTRRA